MALLGQFRRDTLENWSTINPMLADGEFIIVRDNTNTYTIGYKTGNGYSRFNDLGYNSNVTFLNELGDNEQAGISQKFTGQIINDYNISNLHTNEIAADPAFGTNKFTLSQAIAVIPASVLKQGLVITFISSETNEWKRYQNVGTPFTTLQNWEDLASSVNVIQPPGDLDANDYLYNIYYAPITGKVTYEPSRLTTNFIQVDNGQIIDYTIYGYTSSIAIAAFDANQNIIFNKCVITSSLTGETGRYIVDSDNIRFLRFTRLNNATGLNQAVSFYKPDYLPNIEESTKGIRQFSESDFIVEGMYINPVTGKDVANASWNATDFIPVVEGELIFNKNLYGTTGGAVIAFYDGAKVPVELIRGNTAYDANFVTVPEGALYVRFSMATSMPVTIKIINGTNRTQMLSEDKGEIIVDGFDKFYVTGTWSRSGKDLTVTGGSFTQARYDTPTFEDEFVMSCRVRSTVATGGGFETGIGKTSPTAGYVDRWIMMCKDSTGSYLKSYYRPNGSFAEQTAVRQKLTTELVLNKWYVLQLIKTTDEKSAITGRLYDEETGELLASFRTTAAPYAWGYPVAINRTGQAQFSGFVMSYPKKSYPLVAVYGDSFIEGNSIEATKNLRYSALLQSVLGKYQCLLFGHGGATSLSDDSRTLLQIEKVNSAYAIIAYGDNDVDFNTWYKYVAYMIQMCEVTNTLPVFVTVCPRVSQSAAYVAKMQAINNWIRTSGYPYIDANEACTSDGLTWKTGYVLDDGQHPSVLGHQAIFNKIKSDCGFLVENAEVYSSTVQELGDSETKVMSQKSVTIELLNLFSSLYVLPYLITPKITDEGSNVFWMSLTPIISKKGSIIKVTFSVMPSIIEPIGISTVKDVTQVLDYLPFYVEENSVYFVVTQDNISYLRFKLSSALTGTVTVGASDKYTLSTWLEQVNPKINLLQAQTSDIFKTPVATFDDSSTNNVYWWTLQEFLNEGVLYSFEGEVDKITKVQVASGYGTEYLLGEVEFIILNNILYFRANYDNANNIRVLTSSAFVKQPILHELYSVSLSEYGIPDLKRDVEYLESNILNTNMLPYTGRWDANTVFNAQGWFAFRTATLSIVDDYVQVVTAGSIIYEGIRFNSIDEFKGKNVKISFDYKNISNTTILWFFTRTDVHWELNPTNEWKTFTITIPYIDSYDRLQLSTINGTPIACSFAVRNISIINLDNNTLESRVDELEEKINPLEGKNIAIIGDSISTINENNTPYINILSSDVGKPIQSWVTWYDVWSDINGTNPTNKTIGGVSLTQEMIGTLQSFTPVTGDIGKQIGVAPNYNSASIKVWSEVLCQKTGATLLSNASWSGSRITQRSASINSYTLSHAWSDYTIGRCRVRDSEGNYINPDVIIIYRGTNDFSHVPYSSIEDYDMSNGIPDTDLENGTYNFRKGYELTIQKLREAYPNAYIICCTLNIFKRIIYDKFPTRNGEYTLPQMNNVIRDIANTMGCGLIELDKDGITFENCYPTYISDSETTPTHPNNNGHAVMGYKANSDIKYIFP